MIRKLAGARQPDFVTPPRPAQTDAGSQTITPLAAVPALPLRLTHSQTPANSANSIPHPPTPPCDSIVSYGAATPMRRMRRISDTKKIVTDTKSVAHPYLAPRHRLHKLPLHATTKSANLITPLPNPRDPSPIRHTVSATAQLRPLYKFDTSQVQTTFLQIRRVSKCRMAPYLAPPHRPPKTPSPHHDEIHQPHPVPRSTAVELLGPIRASYGSGTNGTLSRYKSLVHSYGPSSTPYLAQDYSRPQIFRSAPRRNPITSNLRPLSNGPGRKLSKG